MIVDGQHFVAATVDPHASQGCSKASRANGEFCDATFGVQVLLSSDSSKKVVPNLDSFTLPVEGIAEGQSE